MRYYFLLLVLVPLSLMAQTTEPQLQDPVQEARARSLFQEIRCMVCSGESIADSRAKLAIDMRGFIRESIAHGKSDAHIIETIRQSYGDEILMRPPVQGNTFLLWLAPVALLMIGGIAMFFVIRKPSDE